METFPGVYFLKTLEQFLWKHLGTGAHTKTDEFSEKFQKGGGGPFSIQKFMLQILDFK